MSTSPQIEKQGSAQLPELMTPEQVSEYLQQPAATLSRWRCAGIGPVYVKIGRNVRYPRSRLEEYILQHTHESSVRANERS